MGFGLLGQYLVDRITNDPAASAVLELAFVWNRSLERLVESSVVPPAARCTDLADVALFSPDIIVEVCHPDVIREWGTKFLAVADVYVGSPTAFADPETDRALRSAAQTGPHALYVPSGALWGAQDLARMAARGALSALRVTMKKHPASLKLGGTLGEVVARLLAAGAPPGETVLYEGPVRGLAPLAPNNVNTMAAAAIAAPSLGFDGVVARLVRTAVQPGACMPTWCVHVCLVRAYVPAWCAHSCPTTVLRGGAAPSASIPAQVADASLDAHVITVEATGAVPAGGGPPFRCVSERYNPAPPGAVTGQATYAAFLSSLLAAAAGLLGPGLHMC